MRDGRPPHSPPALEVERTISPDATATHIPFSFTLDSEPHGLEIRFSYEPAILADGERARESIEAGMLRYADALPSDERADAWRSHLPVRNLLTLSLDGPSGFRGCAHRSRLEAPAVLGRTTATPGFIPGAIEPGTWTATVSVHLVATERCTFRLMVRTT